MMQLCIIADDLTGAIDTGVQLAKQGIATSVIPFRSDEISNHLRGCSHDVLIFNTESRHIAPEMAAARVGSIVEAGRKLGVLHYYKKTDSTMRGNVGAELEAFLTASEKDSLLFVPAHPRLKRYTKKGFQFIGETLLHDTEFGKDPLEPINNSKIPELLQQQTNLPVHLMAAGEQTSANLDAGIYVPDCGSEADLAEISEFAIQHGLTNYLSGSAALAENLPQLLGLSTRQLPREIVPAPFLLINGSMNSISHRQVKYAEAQGIKRHLLSSELLSDSEDEFETFSKGTAEQLRRFYSEQKDVVLSTAELKVSLDGKRTGISRSTDEKFDLVANRIGRLMNNVLEEVPYRSVIVFGGDTSLGIMRALGCSVIEPMFELLSGVALSLARFESRTLLLITKPGGYGEEDTIIKINNYIRKQKG